jgi:hypothetical protein
MNPGEGLGEAVRLGVEQEIDIALAIKRHILGAMTGDRLETQLDEERGKFGRFGRGIFDELEPVGPHRIFKQCDHDQPLTSLPRRRIKPR